MQLCSLGEANYLSTKSPAVSGYLASSSRAVVRLIEFVDAQTLNGTCTLLQVRRVSTVILRTETRWENAIEKSKMPFKCGFGFGFGLNNSVAWQTQRANLELRTLKTHQNSNLTIHNVQQRTAGYGAKRLVNLIQFYRSYPCFR